MAMSQVEADRFVRDLRANTELEAEVRAKGSDIAEITKVAIARGYSVAEEQVRASIASRRPVLTEEDEDLGHISGELKRNMSGKTGF
jgi:hypothetical protein